MKILFYFLTDKFFKKNGFSSLRNYGYYMCKQKSKKKWLDLNTSEKVYAQVQKENFKADTTSIFKNNLLYLQVFTHYFEIRDKYLLYLATFTWKLIFNAQNQIHDPLKKNFVRVRGIKVFSSRTLGFPSKSKGFCGK